jgi:hypothetical protein
MFYSDSFLLESFKAIANVIKPAPTTVKITVPIPPVEGNSGFFVLIMSGITTTPAPCPLFSVNVEVDAVVVVVFLMYASTTLSPLGLLSKL